MGCISLAWLNITTSKKNLTAIESRHYTEYGRPYIEKRDARRALIVHWNASGSLKDSIAVWLHHVACNDYDDGNEYAQGEFKSTLTPTTCTILEKSGTAGIKQGG